MILMNLINEDKVLHRLIHWKRLIYIIEGSRPRLAFVN